MPTPKISHNELLDMLNYDEKTGEFWWKVALSNRVRLDIPAGCLSKSLGYKVYRIHSNLYYGHVLAWFYVHRTWPVNTIDHIDGVKNNNRICNLREATKAEQTRNRKANKNNSTGYKGVSLCDGKYKSQIKTRGRSYFLGLFDNPIDANEAYRVAAEKMFGEFAKW